MALTPEDVQQKEFAQQFRGYNEIEVDAFLDEVERELTRLIAENDDLRERLANAAAATAAAPPPTAESEELLRRTLLLAQRTADETVASARTEAERVLKDARAQADMLLTAAKEQARAEVGDLDERRRELQQQIESLRSYELEYRTRLTAYLEAQLRDLAGRGPVAPDTPPTSVARSSASESGPSGRPAAPAPSFAPVPPTEPAAPARGTTDAAGTEAALPTA